MLTLAIIYQFTTSFCGLAAVSTFSPTYFRLNMESPLTFGSPFTVEVIEPSLTRDCKEFSISHYIFLVNGCIYLNGPTVKV